jgi:hypothetical protein
VAGTIAHAWQKVRRAEQEAALKQDMLQRGLSVDEIERVLRATAKQPETHADHSADKHVLQEFAEILGSCGASPAAIEEILGMVQSADSASKQAILHAVEGLRDGSAEELKDEQIRAVVRALARPARPAEELATPLSTKDVPALNVSASRFSDAIRPSVG